MRFDSGCVVLCVLGSAVRLLLLLLLPSCSLRQCVRRSAGWVNGRDTRILASVRGTLRGTQVLFALSNIIASERGQGADTYIVWRPRSQSIKKHESYITKKSHSLLQVPIPHHVSHHLLPQNPPIAPTRRRRPPVAQHTPV